ncbi:sulfonate transport system substrate-binding protein [Micrococcus cohnii]|uniref:Sulfonate transport system substrate-binding protein n=1 Tax=Micrococcus cohnii TaxID=993416 RepID=A0A7W7GQG5_9MICC|nr:sulfonate transport system substrate-binding protein [Micrococcus cohnii]
MRTPSPQPTRRRFTAALLAAALPLTLSGCLLQGEGSGGGGNDADTLSIDYATYNPLSLVLRRQGWLEQELKDDGVDVRWVFSAGSNKANELLRAGAVDVGSTAGVAALLNRANGAPTKVVAIANRPEWAALMAKPDSGITEVSQLRGRSLAATRGTDPYFFAVQAIEQAGLSPSDVEIQNLQHADGRNALENGSVAAWAGLDPIMAGAQHDGAAFLHRDLELNTFSVVQADEDFLEQEPETAQTVLDAYERARAWVLDHPEETAQILAEDAGIDIEVARTVIRERTNADVSPVPGDDLRDVLARTGPILVDTGDVDYQHQVDAALDTLFDPRFAEEATR